MAHDKELTSFNQELADFNIDSLTIEELEQRLELIVANIASFFGSCGTFDSQCVRFSGDCGTF